MKVRHWREHNSDQDQHDHRHDCGLDDLQRLVKADIAAHKTVEAEPLIERAMHHDSAGDKNHQRPDALHRRAVGEKNKRSQHISVDDDESVNHAGNAATLESVNKIQSFLFHTGKGNTFAANKKASIY